MKPDKLPPPETIDALIERLGSEPIDLELFILKCHLVVERYLYWLLATRLGVSESALPPLQYFPLAKLALAGGTHQRALARALALNDLRNEFGHELDDTKLVASYRKFCKKLEVFWGSAVPVPSDIDLKEARDSSVRVAAVACVRSVYVEILELSLAMGLYSAAETPYIQAVLSTFRTQEVQEKQLQQQIRSAREMLARTTSEQ